MIGASKDAVISWENGRNPVSESFLNRIVAATGVDRNTLSRGDGIVLDRRGFPYTRATCERWRNRRGPERLQSVLRDCEDTLSLILEASARAGSCRLEDRFDGVFVSFITWAEQTRNDFKLGNQIDQLLAQRRIREKVGGRFGQFRNAIRTGPFGPRRFNFHFKDDPHKRDSEQIEVVCESIPTWTPGGCMYPKRQLFDCVLQGRFDRTLERSPVGRRVTCD
jgi:hypothetical protein